MLYPQNGSIAIGSRRTTLTCPAAAAVVSEPIVAPISTPCTQLVDSSTSGIVVARRPPKIMAEIGTPSGSSACGESAGLLVIGVVKRLFGCAALAPEPAVHGLPRQSIRPAGGGASMPSHQISPSGVIATLVNSESWPTMRIALGFERALVPGATPK